MRDVSAYGWEAYVFPHLMCAELDGAQQRYQHESWL
jgi:hypothetical protein